MPALQVRDLPQDLYDRLKARAEAEHRSLAQEATAAIEGYLDLVPVDSSVRSLSSRRAFDYEGKEARIAKRKALFEEIHRLPKIEIPDDFPTAAELIREDRDSR